MIFKNNIKKTIIGKGKQLSKKFISSGKGMEELTCNICRRRCCSDCFSNSNARDHLLNNLKSFEVAVEGKRTGKQLLEIKLEDFKARLEKIKRKEELKSKLSLKRMELDKLKQQLTNVNELSYQLMNFLRKVENEAEALKQTRLTHAREREKTAQDQEYFSSTQQKLDEEISEERDRLTHYEIRGLIPILPSISNPENEISILNFCVSNILRAKSLRIIDYAFVYGTIINIISAMAKYLDVWLPNEVNHRGVRSSIRNKSGFAISTIIK